ncbi:hypothetical protein JCM33374_g3471 [Metschnikowia sp. JCM 33374]|nr:hypothetical protein JCM33374_g3471 [Metschnikowia sp. JCM 33374]
MKFVALISGGKDSFYNIMHCMNNGHSLVALANLHPSDASVNELDSFMFQTVGHDIIDYYRQCIGGDIPLYRRKIKGRSSNVALEYEVTRDDEIEDLYKLLKSVKRLNPDIEGVSCGAILSHYQRTRVENVCDRLGLTCLSYLWQRDQAQLMSEMCSSGLDAILIKVATIGLNEKHLGKSISEVFPILKKLKVMFDVHVCGEGGEFETLVLDAPFFVKRLQVKDSKVFHHSSDSSYLSVNVEVVEKEGPPNSDMQLQFPSLLSEDFEGLMDGVCEPQREIPENVHQPQPIFQIRHRVAKLGTNLYIGNLTSTFKTVEEQTQNILSHLSHLLEQNQSSFWQIQHMTVLVQDMADFDAINVIYEAFFQGIFLPPSRVCIQTILPSPNKLQVSCIASTKYNFKSGIHIRSRSYWAPQNIGPYSQAIVDTNDEWKYATLSGQIPLVPSSMLINEESSSVVQTTLSLQHLYKVKSQIKVNQVASFICYITGKTSPALVSEIWKRYVCEIEHGKDFTDRLLIVKVTALPRQASIEWGGIAYQKVVDMYSSGHKKSTSTWFDARDLTAAFKTTTVILGHAILIKFVGNEIRDLMDFLRSPKIQNTSVNVMSDIDTIHQLSNSGFRAEWVPVLGVYDSDGSKYAYGVVWTS